MEKYIVQGKLKEPSGTIQIYQNSQINLPFGVVVYSNTTSEAEKIVRYMFKSSGAMEIKNEASDGVER